MSKSIVIGKNKFTSKKSALEFYKKILNSYEVNDIISIDDFDSVYGLLHLHPNKIKKIGCGINYFRIGIAKFNTKSFELVRFDGSTEFLSFTKRINKPIDLFTKFQRACREAIQVDLIKVKQNYFKIYAKESKAKCQETGELLPYEELVIDHRQPNTFSVIVDRFIEVNKVDINKVKYIKVDGAPNTIADKELEQEFIKYHKEKANLRLVKKRINSSRAYQGRIRKTKKDLTIED